MVELAECAGAQSCSSTNPAGPKCCDVHRGGSVADRLQQVVERFDSENLFVGKQHLVQATTAEQATHSAALLQPLRLHRLIKEVDTSNLITMKSQLPLHCVLDALPADAKLPGHLPHGQP